MNTKHTREKNKNKLENSFLFDDDYYYRWCYRFSVPYGE